MVSDKVCSSKNKRPVMALLDLLSRRWALRILWELKEGALTFRSLQQRCGGISPTVMNTRIAEMRDAKILEQIKGEGYLITKEGLRLCETLLHLNNWANDMSADKLDEIQVGAETARFCPLCGLSMAFRTIEAVERQACPDKDCGYVFWDNPVPVVAAVVEHDGSIILAQNKAWPENTFGLITGFLEKNETVEEAVKREVAEELGLDSLAVDFIGTHSFIEMNQVIIGFHVKTEGEIVVGEELAEIKPVDIHKLKPWPFGTGLIVQKWLEKYNS